MDLTLRDRALLDGDQGEAARLAMRLVVAVGRTEGAPHLIDIESAHIDGCLFHGRAGLDFVECLVGGGGAVAVPTTLNVSSLDLLHPDLFRGNPETAAQARALMDGYIRLGCQATWTCAPYQLTSRPGLGSQIAWGESNAIVFANSVLGARTNRYGDFMDIACALTGRAPAYGLHTDAGRRASLTLDIEVPDHLLNLDLTYPLIGHVLGRRSRSSVAAVTGLDHRADEDRLKALGATAASSGSVALFHAVGVTPEAPTLEAVIGSTEPMERFSVTVEDLRAARRELTTGGAVLGAVSVGTPHMSLLELAELARLTAGSRSRVPFYANTGRAVYEEAELEGVIQELGRFGATVVTDTCTYVTSIMDDVQGTLMTNSGKLAYYAPANLGVEVAIASLRDCVASATAGIVIIGDLI